MEFGLRRHWSKSHVLSYILAVQLLSLLIPMSIISKSQIDYQILKDVRRLYSRDTFTHVYIMFDIIYELENIDVYFNVSPEGLCGYLLIWHGPDVNGIHIWGNAGPLIRHIPTERRAILHVYAQELCEEIISYLRSYGPVRLQRYLNMTANKGDFKPYCDHKAELITIEHLNEFLNIKRIQDRGITISMALDILKKRRYYGLWVDGKLVSIACAYVRTNDVWVIGDVFTHPKYRGKGYAKAVTSAITRDALFYNASPLLHVDQENVAAKKLYETLGYRVVSSTPWIFYGFK